MWMVDYMTEQPMGLLAMIAELSRSEINVGSNYLKNLRSWESHPSMEKRCRDIKQRSCQELDSNQNLLLIRFAPMTYTLP